MEVVVNYLAILLAAVLQIAIGFVWYGPLFGKQWMNLMGFTEQSMNAAKAKGMTKQYVIMALGSLVMSYVLAHSLMFTSNYLQVFGLSAGIQAGIWNWLGFIVPVTLSSVLWEGKPWKLWMLNAGYYLVSLVLMGILLALWI